jgi:hypothetical protein
MYINYISLNKTCPRICQIIDSTASCELLSFLHGYLNYHQISLASDDEEKNIIYHTIWDLLLHQDDIRAKERGSKLSEVHLHHLGASDWEKRQRLY